MGLEKVRMGGDMSIAVLIEAVDYIIILCSSALTWTSIISSGIIFHIYNMYKITK